MSGFLLIVGISRYPWRNSNSLSMTNIYQIPTTLERWPSCGIRRASVNSFGYGGTNAHVILDEAKTYLDDRSSSSLGSASRAFPVANHVVETAKSRKLFVFTANDDIAGAGIIRHTIKYLKVHCGDDEKILLGDLAFTLSERRTMLPHKLAVSASTVTDLIQELEKDKNTFRKSLRVPKLGFVFTGQGAQWAGMGIELCGVYPIFDDTLLKADICLGKLGCPWHIMGKNVLFFPSSSQWLWFSLCNR